MSDADVGSAPYQSVTLDGLTVSSNDETADAMRDNLSSQAKPRDGEEPDPEAEEAERVSKAAAELGKKGGKAAAEKRAAAPEKAEQEGEEEPEPEKSKEPPEKPLGKPRDDPRARMLEATRKESEAKRQLAEERRERERLAAEVRELRSRPAERPAADAPAVSGRPKPKEDDFENYGDFVDARARWAAAEEFESRRREAEARAMVGARQEGIVRAEEAFKARIAEARKTDPEFLDRISPDLRNLQPSYMLGPGQAVGAHNIIADEIISSDSAPGLMLFLTEHPDDLQRIAALTSSREIAREMAKLEARMEAATAGTSSERETSKAKPPVRPVTGSPTTATPDDVDDDMPFEAHVRRMNAREFGRRSASGR